MYLVIVKVVVFFKCVEGVDFYDSGMNFNFFLIKV